jgi:uncharacterized membrane protein
MRGILAIFLGLSLLFLGLGTMRSESGLIHAFDTGIYLQILSNLLAGRGFASSIVQEPQFLAHHFQPVVALLLPFHALSGGAWMLLLVGWMAAIISCFYLIRTLPRLGIASASTASLAALAFFLHPTLSSRVYYSFVPEVLALPPLTYLACQLAAARWGRRDVFGMILALAFVGLCKENYWLVSSWVAMLLAARAKGQERKIFAVAALSFLGIMLFLFLKWMPEHTQLKSYYGLSYFSHEGIPADWGLPGRIWGAALNIISPESLLTGATVLLVIPCGLILFGSIWTTVATLPSLGLVMAASNDQIHDLSNHYLLAALPFLAVSVASGWERLHTRITAEKARFYGSLLLVLIPASFTFMHHSGFIFQLLFASERMDWRLRAATELLKKELTPEDVILIDGQLQPFFHDFPRVRIIQAFQGNPSPLTAEDRATATHIITANDLSALSSCDEVKADPAGLVRYDLDQFLAYCRWLKAQTVTRTEYLPERLIHLKVEGARR